METLVRLSLKPIGVWTTPWQADSLMGSLAVAWVRQRGVEALKRDFLEPWLAGEPRFIISDAFPADALPAPASLPLPLWDWPPDRRKRVKKTELLSPSAFSAMQRGERPDLPDLDEDAPTVRIRDGVRMRNEIGRSSDSAGGQGGNLFPAPYQDLSDPDANLTIYARADAGGLDILVQSLELLGLTGYGARATAGHGGFDLDGDPEPCPELDDVPGANAFISLSTYQPAPTDPTDGYWRGFVKYGKMAPEFHGAKAIFKRPQVMLRPGACFRTGDAPKPYYGAAIPAERLLGDGARQRLAERGVHPVQAAFALALPMVWKGESGQ